MRLPTATAPQHEGGPRRRRRAAGGSRRGAAAWRHRASAVGVPRRCRSCGPTGGVDPAAAEAGGGGTGGSGGSAGGASGGPATATAARPELARFYSQQLSWRACQGGECATLLEVPVDYANRRGETIELAVLRVKAESHGSGRWWSTRAARAGPGSTTPATPTRSSGRRCARHTTSSVSTPAGWASPRRSTASTTRVSTPSSGWIRRPDDPAEEQAFVAGPASSPTAARQHGGALLAHVSTVEAAKDMDVLRAALGEAQLHYLGKSYGTFLGATYAGLFPSKVGRFVLDGVVAAGPHLLGVVRGPGPRVRGGHPRVCRQDCIKRSNCPVGSTVEEGMQWLRDFLKSLDGQPLRVTNDARVTSSPRPGAPSAWPCDVLQAGLATPDDGAAQCQERQRRRPHGPGQPVCRSHLLGRYEGNIMEVIYAVNCLDRPGHRRRRRDHEKNEEHFAKVRPDVGSVLAWGSVPCGVWPIQRQRRRRKITAPRAAARSSSSARPATRPPSTNGRSVAQRIVQRGAAHLRRGRPHGIHPVQRRASTSRSTTTTSRGPCRPTA
jgi:pimeloyl-ACP methyl ester carboxylesterase